MFVILALSNEDRRILDLKARMDNREVKKLIKIKIKARNKP